MEPATLPSSPMCARHPDLAASFTCSRCGAFACDGCRGSGDLCRSCSSRTQGAFTLGEAVWFSVRSPLGQLRAVLVFVAAAVVPSLLWALSSEGLFPVQDLKLLDAISPGRDPAEVLEALWAMVPRVAPRLTAGAAARVVSYLVELLAEGALVVTFVGVVEGRPVKVGSTWLTALRRYWPLLIANMVAGIGSWLGMLLCILPGLAVAFACSLLDPLVILGRRGAFSAIADSARMSLRAWAPLLILTVGFFAAGFLFGALSEVASRGFGGGAEATQVRDAINLIWVPFMKIPGIAATAFLWVRLETQAHRSQGV